MPPATLPSPDPLDADWGALMRSLGHDPDDIAGRGAPVFNAEHTAFDRFVLAVAAAAVFSLGLTGCGESDVTDTMPAEEARPLDEDAPGALIEPVPGPAEPPVQ